MNVIQSGMSETWMYQYVLIQHTNITYTDGSDEMSSQLFTYRINIHLHIHIYDKICINAEKPCTNTVVISPQ